MTFSKARLVGELNEDGGVNRLLQPALFLTDGTFITKQGRLVCGLELSGLDLGCLDQRELVQIVRHYENAQHVLDEKVQLNQYLVKRRVRPRIDTSGLPDGPAKTLVDDRNTFLDADQRLYEIRLFVVLVHDGLATNGFDLASWVDGFSYHKTVTFAKDRVEKGLAQLEELAREFEHRLSMLQPRRMDGSEMFQFLRLLVNYDDPGVRLKEWDHLDYHMSDEGVSRTVKGLMVGAQDVRVLSMKTTPAKTNAAMFGEFAAIPGDLIVCVQWRREDVGMLKLALGATLKLYDFFSAPVVATAMKADANAIRLDRVKQHTAGQIDEALLDIETSRDFYGWCALTVVCHGEHAENTALLMKRAMAMRDGVLVQEARRAVLPAWLSIVPGNTDMALRQRRMLNGHAADMSSLFSVAGGQPEKGYAGRGPIMIFDTPEKTPYYFSPYVKDVGHRFTSGETGSGKTVTEAALMAAVQVYKPNTFALDFGRGYQPVIEHFGGHFIEFGLDATVPMNPLDQPDSPAHRQFVLRFVRMLMEGNDLWRMTDAQERVLAAAIASVFDPTFLERDRRLTGIYWLLDPPWNARLEKWLEGNRYGHIFDHPKDAVQLSRIQGFEFSRMTDKTHEELLPPLLSYIFHRIDMAVRSGNGPTYVAVAEADKLLRNPIIREQVEIALDTWRKYDGMLCLETQDIGQIKDIEEKTMRAILGRCHTMIFLPMSHAIDEAMYQKYFGFNDQEIENLEGLRPRQAIIRRGNRSRIVNVTFDPKYLPLYRSPIGQHAV